MSKTAPSIAILVCGLLIASAEAQEFSQSPNPYELERLPGTELPELPLVDEEVPQGPAGLENAAVIGPAIGEPAWTTPPPPPPPGQPGPWYSPGTWIKFKEWDATFELGINGASGNSESLSIKTGAVVKREFKGLITKADISYARTNADSAVTQDLFIADLRLDYEFANSRWSVFINENLTRDQLRIYPWRLTINAGGGFKIIDTETTSLNSRFGAGVSREFGGPVDDDPVPEGVFGLDFEHQLTKKQKLTGVLDYFPDWSDFGQFRLTTKVGWELVIDDNPNLSLKLEASDRYDSTPNGALRNDINYSLLLLWKL